LNKKVNYYKHRISYLTGTCYNFELEEFLAWFRVARFVSDSWAFLLRFIAFTLCYKTRIYREFLAGLINKT